MTPVVFVEQLNNQGMSGFHELDLRSSVKLYYDVKQSVDHCFKGPCSSNVCERKFIGSTLSNGTRHRKTNHVRGCFQTAVAYSLRSRSRHTYRAKFSQSEIRDICW